MSHAEHQYLNFIGTLGSKSIEIDTEHFSCTISKENIIQGGLTWSCLEVSKVNIKKNTSGRFMYFLDFVENHNPKRAVFVSKENESLIPFLQSIGYETEDEGTHFFKFQGYVRS